MKDNKRKIQSFWIYHVTNIRLLFLSLFAYMQPYMFNKSVYVIHYEWTVVLNQKYYLSWTFLIWIT